MQREEQRFLHALEQAVVALQVDIPGFIDRCGLYYRELRRWLKAYNLTGIEEPEAVAVELFADSLLYLLALPEDEWSGKRIIDIGTGAGFPGMVMKVARPDLDITLLEPSRKRVAFLRQIRSRLQLQDTHIIGSRIESMPPETGRFDILVTRALFSVSEFIKKTVHIRQASGILVMNKGPRYSVELKEAEPVLLSQGLGSHVRGIVLPVSHKKRYLISIVPQ